ncbi:MAG: cytochrome d ubiquinol oxidase subunit II, partial [Steroidobacteraceae bacterium]
MSAELLPVIFMCLMGIAMLTYVALDGYDLGVGMLLPLANKHDKDTMIASIGPFWDANETWLVLGVGILLIAFPKAQGLVLTAVYLPTTAMLIGLTLRGVAFDFRVKAHDDHQPWWNTAFFTGSLMASVAQGWMLGRLVTGFSDGWQFQLFAALIALALPLAYVLLGSGWLIMKTEGSLQQHAVRWAQRAWLPVAIGMLLISVITPLVSESVRNKWFTLPALFALIPIPLATTVALLFLPISLKTERVRGELCWIPFALTLLVIVLGFFGLAYSLYP